MLHQRIRTLRQTRSMSQVQLARLLGVTKQSVSNWENDNIQPSIEMLKKLAAVFSVSTDYLLGLDVAFAIRTDGLSDNDIQLVHSIVQRLKNGDVQAG